VNAELSLRFPYALKLLLLLLILLLLYSMLISMSKDLRKITYGISSLFRLINCCFHVFRSLASSKLPICYVSQIIKELCFSSSAYFFHFRHLYFSGIFSVSCILQPICHHHNFHVNQQIIHSSLPGFSFFHLLSQQFPIYSNFHYSLIIHPHDISQLLKSLCVYQS